MRFKILALSLLLLLSSAAAAQTYVELVLDASGSMWNKLDDGRYRTVAAKEALADFVSGLPADEALHVGLRIYGSEKPALEEGACQDSRLFVPIEGVSRGELLAAIKESRATGATPIAYSLEQAIEDFPPGGKRLIILVTDGEESCGGDLAAVAAKLGEQGVEIELHIIGFDLSPEAQASFQGIGSFENARSAAELAAALGNAVADAAPPEAASYRVQVTVSREGAPAADGATVEFVDALSGESHAFASQGQGVFQADLPAGAYSAQVADAFSEAPLTFGGLSVSPEADNTFAFELAPAAEVALTVAPAEPAAGSSILVGFEGAPAGPGNWVALAPADSPDNLWLVYADATGQEGQVELRTPDDPTTLEARFHMALPEGGSQVIGRSAPFTTVAATASLQAPDEVGAGGRFEVGWTGPDNPDDFVTIVPAGAAEGSYQDYFDTQDGNPGALTAPIEPGSYELRYATGQSGSTLASRAIEVTEVSASVDPPAQVAGGSAFEVHWTGPDNHGDYITIVPAGAAEGEYQDYAYTRSGNPVTITAPLEPGAYEVRYSTEQAHPNPTMASAAITVVRASYGVEAPAEVEAGASFEVRWTGPGNHGDYITIVPAGAPEGTYLDYAYTRGGNTVTIRAPEEPGTYEVRYSTEQVSPNPTLASVTLQVK